MSESMSCAILFWGVNKPTSFGKLHSSVYHGDLYLFYAIINLILISCDLLYSTNWTISYPSIALFLSCRLSRSTLIGIKSATWPNRRQPIRIGWPLCCRRRRCCCWSTPAQRTRRFRVQMVSRIHIEFTIGFTFTFNLKFDVQLHWKQGAEHVRGCCRWGPKLCA